MQVLRQHHHFRHRAFVFHRRVWARLSNSPSPPAPTSTISPKTPTSGSAFPLLSANTDNHTDHLSRAYTRPCLPLSLKTPSNLSQPPPPLSHRHRSLVGIADHFSRCDAYSTSLRYISSPFLPHAMQMLKQRFHSRLHSPSALRIADIDLSVGFPSASTSPSATSPRSRPHHLLRLQPQDGAAAAAAPSDTLLMLVKPADISLGVLPTPILHNAARPRSTSRCHRPYLKLHLTLPAVYVLC
ncbi:hypothetical protein V8E36_001093 [Tilletia maclaganii]